MLSRVRTDSKGFNFVIEVFAVFKKQFRDEARKADKGQSYTLCLGDDRQIRIESKWQSVYILKLSGMTTNGTGTKPGCIEKQSR